MRDRTISVWFVCAALMNIGLAATARAAPRDRRVVLTDTQTLIALAVCLAVSPVPEADGVSPVAGTAIAPPPAETPASPGPVLELTSTVAAKTLVFEKVPHVRLSYGGSGPRSTTWRSERVNLPARVSPGVTYRDVQVRLTLTSTPEQLDQLLLDAKRAALGIKIAPDAAMPATAVSSASLAVPATAASPASSAVPAPSAPPGALALTAASAPPPAPPAPPPPPAPSTAPAGSSESADSVDSANSAYRPNAGAAVDTTNDASPAAQPDASRFGNEPWGPQ